MKSYKQTIREIYERAEDYEAKKRRRRTRALRIALPAFYICVCLAVVGTVIGVGVRLARQNPDVNIDPLIPGRDTEDAPGTTGGELADYDKSQNTGKPAEDKRNDVEGPDSPAPCTERIPEADPLSPTRMFFRNANAVLIHWNEQIDVSSFKPVWSEMITSRDEKTVETICDEAGNVIGGVDSVSAWTTVQYYSIPVSSEEFFWSTLDGNVIPVYSSSWNGNLNSILVPDCYLDRVRPGECALVFLDKISYQITVSGEVHAVYTPGLRPDKYYGDGKFNEPNIIDVTDGKLVVTDATREAPIWTEVAQANVWADARALPVCRLEIGTKITELTDYFNAVSVEVRPPEWEETRPPEWEETRPPVSSGDDTTPADRDPKEMPADALDLAEFWAAERQQALIAGVTLDLRYVYIRTLKLVLEHDAVQCTLPAYAGAYVFLTEPLGPLSYISHTANGIDAVPGWFDCAAILAAEDSARYDAIYRLFIASLTCGFPDRIVYDDNWSIAMSRLPSPELFVSFDCDLEYWGYMEKYYAKVLTGGMPTRETYSLLMSGEKFTRCLDNRQHEDVLPVLQDLYGEYFRGIPVDPPVDTTPPPEDSTDGPIPETTVVPDGPNPPVPDYTDTAPLNAYLLEFYGGRTGDVPPIDELWVIAFKAFQESYFRSNVVEFCVAPELHAAFVGLLADLPSYEEGGILFFYGPVIDDVLIKYDPARGIASAALVPMVDQGCKREFEAVVYTAVLSHLLENYGNHCTISAGSKLLFSRTHSAASADEWAKIILSGEYVRADFETFSFIEGQSSADSPVDLYATVCASYVDELF